MGRNRNGLLAMPMAALIVAVAALANAQSERAVEPAEEPEQAERITINAERLEDKRFVLRHDVKRIDGKDEQLAKYDGKVVLIVNVASRCGLTPQYEGLEKLYRNYKDRGLVILGFPANDFGRQEPGTNEEIAQFCSERFDVTFPMFEKIVVTGEKKDPLYEQLAGLPEPLGGEPKWNFTKFLVGRDGIVTDRFEPRVKPTDEDLIERIEMLLGPADAPERQG